MMKLSLFELMAKVAEIQKDLEIAIVNTDTANAEAQQAWVDGKIAKRKLAKCNTCTKREEELRAELAEMQDAVTNGFTEAVAEATADEETYESFWANLKNVKLDNKKVRRSKAEMVKEAKELDPKVYEERMLKEAEKAQLQKEAAEIKERSKAHAKEKAEGVLVLKPSGIWARRETKSAKESARWMRMLLDMKDARDSERKHVDLITEKEIKDHEAFAQYWNKIHFPVMYFTSDEVECDRLRRQIQNAKDIDKYGYGTGFSAKQSALAFSDVLIAAAKMLDKDFDVICEQGCKLLFEEIDRYNKAISVIEDEIEDKAECIQYLRDNDHELIHDIILESVSEVFSEKRPLQKQVAELKAERRLLFKAVELARKATTESEAALIDAHADVVMKKAKAEKVEEGRTYVPLAKPEMKGYRMPSLLLNYAMPKELRNANSAATKAAMVWLEAYEGHENGLVSDDDFRDASKPFLSKLKELRDIAKDMRDSGVCYEADDSRCQYNSSRQSQLADVIGVPYGSDTDMVLSLDHSMANFMSEYVMNALTLLLGQQKASDTIDTIETLALEILTRNGLYMKYRAKKEGESRIVHYYLWNANNSEQKLGKCKLLSDKAYDIAKEASQAGMSDEEFEKIKTSGSDMLKWWSYSGTPGCVMTYNDEAISVDDVLVVDSVEFRKKFSNVLDFRMPTDKKTWQNGVKYKEAFVDRTAFDGQLFFLVPIPSQQLRGGMSFKGYGVCCAYEDGTTMIDEIARREGRKIPETIKDIDGVEREWRKYKVIATKDAWKWASYGITYAEYCERMNKLAEKYPTVNKLYTARIADATEESARHLTRQSSQQFLFANDAQIERLYERAIRKLDKLRTHEGVIRKIAGLDKEEEERNAFEHLIEMAPEFLDNNLMKRYVEDVFNRSVAEAAVRPVVDGIYPYICEDPVAFFKIVLWGEDPNKLGLGYLKADEVNIPGAGEGKEMYLVRYPNNYLCGMIAKNHNDDIYRCVGNTMVLSADGYWLTRADGDVDGDEMCAIFNEVVIELMKGTIATLNPPLVLFPHASLEKKLHIGFEARAKALAGAMVIANKFGPAVGQNSNLATKFMAKAATARMAMKAAIVIGNKDEIKKQQWIMNANLSNAIIAHIAAIIAIDLAKTGTMPKWLQNKLDEITKYAGGKMPWNQRFCRDNKSTPWFDARWDNWTNERTDGIVDKGAGYVIDKTDAYNYEAPTGDDFDFESVMCDKTGLYIQGSRGKLDANFLFALDARNYMKGNAEGDDEVSLIARLHSTDEKDTVSFAELMRFFWRNMAQLMYKLGRDDSDNIQSANLVTEYYATVREIMLHFGSYCGNAKFASLTPEQQAKSNVWHAMKLAFGENSIGNERKKEVTAEIKGKYPDASKEELKKLVKETLDQDEAYQSAKASYAIFSTKVFAPDLCDMVAEKKGYTDAWHMPEPVSVIKKDDDGAPINSISDEELEALRNSLYAA